MGFQRVRLYNYRNVVDAEVDTTAPEVFLVGENGQGKTNFLEAVHLLCLGSSFRTRLDGDLIRHGADEMALTAMTRPSISNDSEIEISVRLRRRKKTILVNGKQVRDRKELVERFPCIVFCHEDISFVSGAPENRRRFFNQTMSLNSPVFVDLLRRYNHVIRLRNAAVRSGQFDTLPVFDQQAAAAGLDIVRRRRETVEEFNETFSSLFAYVSGIEDRVTIRYSPSWKGCDSIDSVVEVLNKKREIDRMMMTTTSGPHRDRFVFVYRDRDFSRTASTGQLRLLSLVLRVAQAVHFCAVSRGRPLLLLDDVLLELDPEKRRRFIEVLPEYDQAFFTFLPDERYDRYRRGDTVVYRVASGRFELFSGRDDTQ